MSDPALPTFLIIGAQKSATRWLRLNLGLHPEVFTAENEIAYFSSLERLHLGPQWYAQHFEGWDGEPFVGEATPAYMMHSQRPARIARRIQQFRPDMRLIAVLRNPVDRTYSGFVHHMRKGRLATDTDLMEYIRSVRPRQDPLALVAGSWYHASLKPYLRRFGSKLLIVLHDDVQSDPAGVYDRALRHIGAEPGFRPEELTTTRFDNRPPATSGLRSSEGGYKPLDEEQREAFGYFRDDVRRLEKALGRDLDIWRPSTIPQRRRTASGVT